MMMVLAYVITRRICLKILGLAVQLYGLVIKGLCLSWIFFFDG